MRGLLLVAIATLCVFSCQNSPQQKEKANKPKLVVFISIDQWHHDLLERYKDYYQGGFKMIWEQSRFYANAYHDHAATLTGPGHSVLLTGVYPNKTGITGNYFYDRAKGQELYCVADAESQVMGNEGVVDKSGVSPKNLLVPTLGDLLKQQSPDSKVFSVSGKDRSGILMAGKKADGVFWYDKSLGQLVTSSFYSPSLPEFIKNFNQEHPVQDYNPHSWRRLKPQHFYLENARQDSFPGEHLIGNKNFPYHLAQRTADDTSFNSMIRRTPFADRYILEASQYIIQSQQLGQDDSPDLLSIGLSATDYVGHTWGPYSQEALDHMLRLDRYLGEFFAELQQQFGEDVVIALSSDHGVSPLPEYLTQQGQESAKRISRQQLFDDITTIEQELKAEFALEEPLIIFKDQRYPFFNTKLTFAQKQRLAKEIEKLEYINKVVTSDDIATSITNASDKPTSDAQIVSFVSRVHYQPRAREIYFIFQPHILVNRSLGTTHGSVYDYDQKVPIVLMGARFDSRVVRDSVSTTDIAPTLATLLELEHGDFDGKTLP